MTTYLISPSETKLLERLGNEAMVSPIPENYGADILIYTNQGLIGIQRKSIPTDFIVSATDGRLTRETSLLSKNCKFPILLLEGRFKYWPDTRLAIPGRKEPSKFTKGQIRAILFDVCYIKGVYYDYTEDPADTVLYIKALDKWFNREKHLMLFNRPSGPKGTWTVPSVEEMQSWVLQGFEGVGPSVANSIIEHFNGLPLAWTCTLDELMSVHGVSAKRARYLWDFLPKKNTPKYGFDDLRRKLKSG